MILINHWRLRKLWVTFYRKTGRSNFTSRSTLTRTIEIHGTMRILLVLLFPSLSLLFKFIHFLPPHGNGIQNYGANNQKLHLIRYVFLLVRVVTGVVTCHLFSIRLPRIVTNMLCLHTHIIDTSLIITYSVSAINSRQGPIFGH